MAGVKSMLKGAAQQDMNQTHKASSKTGEKKITPEKDTTFVDIPSPEETLQTSFPEKVAKPSKKKNSGGRPTNKEKGIKSRKQYTLTLKEDTYNLILAKAREDELSFAKFMERAALDYIDRHK